MRIVTHLENIEIPDTVRTIGSQAFWSYKKLKKLEIPSSVENVSALVFANCSSLKEIYFYSKNITIDIYSYKKSGYNSS